MSETKMNEPIYPTYCGESVVLFASTCVFVLLY